MGEYAPAWLSGLRSAALAPVAGPSADVAANAGCGSSAPAVEEDKAQKVNVAAASDNKGGPCMGLGPAAPACRGRGHQLVRPGLPRGPCSRLA